MGKSNHIRIIKVDIEMPQSPSKEAINARGVPVCNCCQSLLRGLLERIIIVFLLIVVFGFLSWYIFTRVVYTEHDPDFRIDAATVNTSEMHDQFGDYVRADWTIVMSTRNPNDRTPIVYKNVSVRIFRQLDVFGPWDAIAGPLRQQPKNRTTLTARSVPLSTGTNLQYDILGTVLEFNVTLLVDLSYKCRTCLREGLSELKFFCPQVNVFHASYGPTRKSQQCSVQSKRQL